MKFHPIVRATLLTLASMSSLTACGKDGTSRLATTSPDLGGQVGITANSNIITIPFDRNNFVRDVTNQYYPLTPGTIYTYRTTAKAGDEVNTVEVTREQKTILGVAITVVRDRVYIADGS